MKITAGTIVRTVILAVALVNQILVASGHSVIPIPDEDWENLITTGATVITALIAWWKNNSFTAAARLGDFAMRRARQVARENKRLDVKDDDDKSAGLPVS